MDDMDLMDLTHLSMDELESLAQNYALLEQTNDVSQYVTKILQNSSFGSLSMEVNSFSHGQGLSAAITTAGRLANRWANHSLSNFIAKVNGEHNTTGYDYSKQCDTDSVVGSTIIYVNGHRISIEDYYNSLSGDNFIKKDVSNDYYVRAVTNDMTLSYSKDLTIQEKYIIHIMKHKVTKGMYKIKIGHKEVIITEDHSIMVMRDAELISAKPAEMLHSDMLVSICSGYEAKTHSLGGYEIIFEGVREEWVYDIEVEDNHNFFANDILVHNSGYVDISSLVDKKIARDNREYTIEEKYNLVNTLSEKVLYPQIQKAIDEVAYVLNALDSSFLIMEQETIAEKFVSVADKRYFCRGLKFDKVANKIKPYFKITGLNIIGKSTPPYCKEKLTPVLDLILDTSAKEVVDYIEDIRKDFVNQPIQSISVIKGVSSIDYDKSTFKTIKNGKSLTAPIHSRGSIIHNNIVTERKMDIPHIVAGDKVYYTYLKLPNPIMSDVISYNDPRFMTLSGLLEYVDYNTLFEKNFKKSISLITEPIGWSLDPYQDAMDDWF